MCEFKKGDGSCRLHKRICVVPDDKIKVCNYYVRQHPSNKTIFLNKFKKALSKAVAKRPIDSSIEVLKNIYNVDYNKSIYENVRLFLEGVPKQYIAIKERNVPNKIDPEINVLKSITTNLYKIEKIEILQKNEEDNTFISLYKGKKYINKTKGSVKDFLSQVINDKNPERLLQKNIVEIVEI